MYGRERNDSTYRIDFIKPLTKGLEPGAAHELVVERVVTADVLLFVSQATALRRNGSLGNNVRETLDIISKV